MDLEKHWLGSFLLTVLAVLFTVMYCSLLFNKNVWTDEAYTIELIRENNFWGIIKNTANDVHPPFYYLLVKVFAMALGDKFYIYKMVSVIPMVLTMALAFIYVKPWWGVKTALLFLILLPAIPCVMEYAVQIRMYSWAMFFVTWAGICAYGMCRQASEASSVYGSGIWIQLAAASLLGCYTHTYAMLSSVCIYILLCIYALCHIREEQGRRLFKKSILSGSIVAVCYLPWLIVLIKQTASRVGNYWIEPITGKVVLQYFSFLFSSRVPYSTEMYLVLCVLAVALCIQRCIRKEKEGLGALMMLAVPVMTAGIGIAVSIAVTPFFIARYLLPCMGLLALFFAIAFQKKRNLAQLFIGIFGILMLANSYQLNYEAEYHSAHTEELLEFIKENMGENDYIVYNFEEYGFIYRIYFDDRIMFLSDMDFTKDFENIWYFDSCITPWLQNQVLVDNGLEKEFVMHTGIEQNDFQLYRIYHAGR